MSRRTVLVVLLLLAMLIATPLEVLSEGRFQEEEPDGESETMDDLRLIHEEESTFVTEDGQTVEQTESVYVSEGSNATSLEDLGVASIKELRESITAPKAQEAEVAGCRTITDFSRPWRVQGARIAAARSKVTRGHGCASRIHYEHALMEKQWAYWTERRYGAFYVYPGYVKSQTLRWSCNDGRRENWAHFTWRGGGSDGKSYRALYCNS